jgi:hypothetical protein
MKTIYRYSLYTLLTALFSFVFASAILANGTHEGRLKPVEATGGLIASLDTRPAPLSLGDDELFLTILDANKKPLNNASVSVTVTMVGMNMKTDNDHVILNLQGKMRYRGVVNLTMGGIWHINVFVDHGNGQHDKLVFEEKVKWE